MSMKLTLVGCAVASTGAVEPNPPNWPSSVTVFEPTDSVADIEAAVNAAYKKVTPKPVVLTARSPTPYI